MGVLGTCVSCVVDACGVCELSCVLGICMYCVVGACGVCMFVCA